MNNDASAQQSGDIPTMPVPDMSNDSEQQKETSNGSSSNEMIIKARPLTIRKPPLSEQPKLRNLNNTKNGISVSINRRIEMPPAFLFPEMDHLIDSPSEMQNGLKEKTKQKDEVDKALLTNNISLNSDKQEDSKDNVVSDITEQIDAVDLNGKDSQGSENVLRRSKKGNLKQGGKAPLTRRVSFDPLALLLDASLEGELELVKKTATQVSLLFKLNCFRLYRIWLGKYPLTYIYRKTPQRFSKLKVSVITSTGDVRLNVPTLEM